MGVISSAGSDGTAVDVGVAFVEVWGVQAPNVAAEAAIPTIFRNSRRESVRRLDIPCSSFLGMSPLSVFHDMNAQVFLKGQEAQLNTLSSRGETRYRQHKTRSQSCDKLYGCYPHPRANCRYVASG